MTYLSTHHPAAVHGPLRALPALRLRLRHFTDGENAPCRPGALLPPVRCRTHACTPTTGATHRERERDAPSFLIAAVSSIKKKMTRSHAAGSLVWLMFRAPGRGCASLFPEQDRVVGRTDPLQLALHLSQRRVTFSPS